MTAAHGTVSKQQSVVCEAKIVTHDSMLEAVSDIETGFDLLPHSTGAASNTTDSCNTSKAPAVVKPGKVTPSKAMLKCKQTNAAPITNGMLENENGDGVVMPVNCRPAALLEVSASLREPEPDVLPLGLTDTGASGDHGKQQPVSPSNHHTESVSDAEFIAVVRRKRRDAGAKQKTRQSEDLCSVWHRRPARPTYVSPKSNTHLPAGTSSPTQAQPSTQKLPNLPGVDLSDSTPSAFPALPSQRVRRSSTGDVPAASESNDDGSDLESVKSMQMSTSRQTAWGRSLGTSSYASVVVGNTSTKEPISEPISQSSTSVAEISPCSDGGLESNVSCPHNSDPSTSDEVTACVSSVKVACSSGPIVDRLDSSDFMVASSLIHEDSSCTDLKIGRDDRPPHSGSSTLSSASRPSVLFFDTRSKASKNPVPSLDISFGFDDSLMSAAITSDSMLVTDEPRTRSVTPQVLRAEQTATVQFLQRSSVDHPSTSSDTSTVSVQRSSFDLRAAQKYLISGEF